MTHYTLRILLCIPTIECFKKKIIQVRKFMAKVAYIIAFKYWVTHIDVTEIPQWLEHHSDTLGNHI